MRIFIEDKDNLQSIIEYLDCIKNALPDLKF